MYKVQRIINQGLESKVVNSSTTINGIYHVAYSLQHPCSNLFYKDVNPNKYLHHTVVLTTKSAPLVYIEKLSDLKNKHPLI